MPHPVETTLGTLRRRARRLLVLFGLSRVLAAVVVTVFVLGLADYLIRFQDRGIRTMALAVFLAVLGWTAQHYLVRGLRAPLRDLELARRIQRRFPALGDRIASSVEFLGQVDDDPTAGSSALRRAVILQATAELESLDLDEVIQRRPAFRAAALAGVIGLAAIALMSLAPTMSQVAVARLVNPWGAELWPRANYLTFREQVWRVARGQAFEVEVIDARGGRLPDEVRLHYRFEGDNQPAGEETQTLRFGGGAMVARRENVTRPFAYRVEGGDDHAMPWIPVEVVEPPAVESLAIRLIPPAYTGWPAASSQKSIHALAGTRVEITGTATKPLRSAAVRLEKGEEIPARLTADGRGFVVPGDTRAAWIVRESGSYWLELEDVDGLRGGGDARWEIRAVPDTPPTVSLEEPAANLYVTANAVVPLRVAAKDDLAIHEIAIRYARTDRSSQGEALLPLYTGPAKPAGAAAASGETRTLAYRWELGPLGFAPKTQVNLVASATDYRPAAGRSQPRQLTVVTPEELADRLAQRQSAILGELERLLKLQKEARTHIVALEGQLRPPGRFQKQDLDRLQGAESSQRQVARGLTGPAEGVLDRLSGLLAEMENNRVDSPELGRRMRAMLAELDRLGKEQLPPLGKELTAALKTGAASLEESPAQGEGAAPKPAVRAALAASLASAGRHQDEVAASLERMLGDLAQWDSYRRFQREVAQLLRDQEELGAQTKEIGRQTLASQWRDLDPRQQEELRTLAERQLDLARRLDKIQQEMAETKGALSATDPQAARTLSAALEHAEKDAISGQMREGGRSVEANQVGQAVQRQASIVESLRRLLEILADQLAQGTSSDQLAQLDRVLKGLTQRQQEVLDQTVKFDERVRQEGDLTRSDATAVRGLGRDEQTLKDETSALAQKLAAAPVFVLALERAAGQMSRAAASLQEREVGAATQEAERSALESLAQLAQALAPESPPAGRAAEGSPESPAGQTPRSESSGRSVAELKLLKLMQERVNRRTRELDAAIAKQGKATPEQSRELAALGREQGRLAELTIDFLRPAEDTNEKKPEGTQDKTGTESTIPPKEDLR